jgi:(p)ppGpp synthase/HD superfamily hydrolase
MHSETFGLDEAIALAIRTHAGQTGKASRPYIEHPLRVMRLRGQYQRMAAAPQDVLRTPATTADDLHMAANNTQLLSTSSTSRAADGD